MGCKRSTSLEMYETDPKLFNTNIVSKAKEPFQFMAMFMALLKYNKNPYARLGVPILFDCSCSGLQHLSMLCSDITLAKLVNVVPGEDDIKSDFYSLAAEFVNQTIASHPKEDLKALALILKSINVTRSIIKLPVMTIPYNITLEGVNKSTSY